ncbi:hypothetical protein BHM03_00001376 [Ensete ventricosum]|nr:hypothetical protein BHM03_00001376 [Ensete ventricosum]
MTFELCAASATSSGRQSLLPKHGREKRERIQLVGYSYAPQLQLSKCRREMRDGIPPLVSTPNMLSLVVSRTLSARALSLSITVSHGILFHPRQGGLIDSDREGLEREAPLARGLRACGLYARVRIKEMFSSSNRCSCSDGHLPACAISTLRSISPEKNPLFAVLQVGCVRQCKLASNLKTSSALFFCEKNNVDLHCVIDCMREEPSRVLS